MRHLHARSNGQFNDFCLLIARLIRPVGGPHPLTGFLGAWDATEIEQITAQLASDGIAIFNRKLPEEACAKLEKFARTTPAMPMGEKSRELYARERARALRYDFKECDIHRSPEACKILFDGTFSTIAAAYFRCIPIYDFAAMWWTTPHGSKDYSLAAQKFHWDMDRLFFLKFFIYLTDVTPDAGPHVFVAGSHRRKPPSLRPDRRYEDQEIEALYPRSAIRAICGPRGTVFAADTRGLHKGQPVVSGDRLVLQVEFAISKFGQNYPRSTLIWDELRMTWKGPPPDRRTFPDLYR